MIGYNFKCKTGLIAGALLFGASSASMAADIYITHGINGTDLGLAEELPVDIQVNGACALTGVVYTNTAGPLDLPAGTYDVEISLSDGNCTGALAISDSLRVNFGENATITAHVTEQGTPTVTKFINDVRPTDDNKARVVIRHGAAAPEVNAYIRNKYRRGHILGDIANSSQKSEEFRPGNYDAFVLDAQWRRYLRYRDIVAGPLPLTFEDDVVYIVNAVGSIKNGTFNVILQTLDSAQ